jgi:hypothetical protein
MGYSTLDSVMSRLAVSRPNHRYDSPGSTKVRKADQISQGTLNLGSFDWKKMERLSTDMASTLSVTVTP